MTEQIQIPIATLKQAARVLLEHVEELDGDVVSVDHDYYWAIAPEQLYDVFREPAELTIGQLTECLDHLNSIIATRVPRRPTDWSGSPISCEP